jgi:hypothetical protein
VSTAYGYLCVTDGATSVTTLSNVGQWVLPQLASVRMQLLEVRQADKLGYFELRVMACDPELVEWLLQHAQHVLALRDEYGNVEPLDVPMLEAT